MTLAFYISFIEVTWVDVIDIGLVGYLLFQLYKLMRGSMAIRIFIGFLVIYCSSLFAKAAGMELITAILEQFRNLGAIALVILFQQEIRKFLLMLGKTTLLDKDSFISLPWRKASNATHEKSVSFSPIIDAAKAMAASHTGALIVFAKHSNLNFYEDSGDLIDALPSKRLLISIFNKHSPMHDGAMIIEKNRIKAVRCILPVSERNNIPAHFGLRHRAAIGISEVTDAVVLVVSEETGQISLVRNGNLEHNLSIQELRSKLNHYILDTVEKTEESPVFGEVQEALEDLRGKKVSA